MIIAKNKMRKDSVELKQAHYDLTYRTAPSKPVVQLRNHRVFTTKTFDPKAKRIWRGFMIQRKFLWFWWKSVGSRFYEDDHGCDIDMAEQRAIRVAQHLERGRVA